MSTRPITRLLVFLWALVATSAAAQRLEFEKDSLPQVLQRAGKLHKPVFILLGTPPAAATATLSKQQTEQRYGSGLNDKAVVSVLQRDFLVMQVLYPSPEARQLAQRFHVSTFPTYLYLHSDGTVLHRSFGNTHEVQRYLHDIETFRQKLASPDNLSNLEKRYAQGERSASFLRQYLLARRSVGAPISAELLDEYVREQPLKAFDGFSEVVFVHELGPVIDSRAYLTARVNKRLVDSMYTALPFVRRQAINNAIISNSLQAAITRRDQKLAVQGAAFAQRTWTSSRDYQRGAQSYAQHMLRYFHSVGDTAQYLPALTRFYEQFYMKVPADTIRHQRARQQTQNSLYTKPTPYTNLLLSDSAQRVVVAQPRQGGADVYALELNNGAWEVYRSGTKRSEYLTQAMRWSQRTIDLDPQPAYYDTLAHLLYALRLTTEAEVTQQKAIAQAKREGQPTTAYQEALRKIKARTL